MSDDFNKYQLAIDVLRERVEELGGELFAEAFLKERIELTKNQSLGLGFLFDVIHGATSELPLDKVRDFNALGQVLGELIVKRDAEVAS